MQPRCAAVRACISLVVVGLAMSSVPARAKEDDPASDVAVSEVQGAAATTAKLVDLNTATLAELDGLPGVGRKRAEAIMAKRPYRRATELLRIKGFGPKMFAKVRPFVTVSPAAPVASSPPAAATERPRVLGK